MVVYIRPLKQQASLWAHNLTQEHELVAMGHCFGKASVLATMLDDFYPKELKWISSANRLKFNGQLVQIDMNLIGPAIIAFVRS